MKLQFDSTVLHNGTLIPGRKIENNQVVFEGAIVDLDTDTRGLKDVAQDLIDRGLAHEVDAPATHTLALVNAAQEAMAKDAPTSEGSAPVADSLKRGIEAQKELAAQRERDARGEQSQQPAASQQPQVQTNKSPAPNPTPAGQPTPEEIANTAASVN